MVAQWLALGLNIDHSPFYRICMFLTVHVGSSFLSENKTCTLDVRKRCTDLKTDKRWVEVALLFNRWCVKLELLYRTSQIKHPFHRGDICNNKHQSHTTYISHTVLSAWLCSNKLFLLAGLRLKPAVEHWVLKPLSAADASCFMLHASCVSESFSG